MALLIAQKYETIPAFGATIGWHKIKVSSTKTDTLSVRPPISISALKVVSQSVTPVRATATITYGGTNLADGDGVTIGNIAYLIETSTLDAAYKVDQGGDADTTAGNLVKAINGTGVSGTDYATGTLPHPCVTASINTSGTGGVITLTASIVGSAGNSIRCTEGTDAGNQLTVTAFSGGVGGTAFANTSTGLITLDGFVADEEIVLLTYHNLSNYSSIG